MGLREDTFKAVEGFEGVGAEQAYPRLTFLKKHGGGPIWRKVVRRVEKYGIIIKMRRFFIYERRYGYETFHAAEVGSLQ